MHNHLVEPGVEGRKVTSQCHHCGGGSIEQDGTLHSYQRKCHGPRDEKVVLHACVQTSWPFKRHSVGSRPKVHEQVLVNLVEAHGIKVQDEHLIPTPNGWTNRKSELGHPTILKELCDDGSIRLGGPLGVGRILLQQFGAFNNGGHPFSNGDRKSPIMSTTWASHGQPLSDASEEVPIVTQLDEERRRLWEMAKANLEKVHKRY
jgi:hypothetical protein